MYFFFHNINGIIDSFFIKKKLKHKTHLKFTFLDIFIIIQKLNIKYNSTFRDYFFKIKCGTNFLVLRH